MVSWRGYAVLALLLVTCAVAGLGAGSADLSSQNLRETLLGLRAIRALAACLVGAALAVAGVVVQGMFRNPLASPSVLGTTAGAHLGGQLALLVYGWLVLDGSGSRLRAEWIVPLGCFIGAALSLAVLLGFLWVTDRLLTLLLVGFALSSLLLAVSGFVTSVAQNTWELGRAVVAFSLGSVSGVGSDQLAFVLPLVAVGVVQSYRWGTSLDLLLSGEDEATSLGLDVGQARRWCAIWVGVLVACAVSIGGGVSFVGLVVPHALRPWFGARHRALIPAAALLGAAFVMACDVLGRSIGSAGEVPLGVITGLIGAPAFMVLLRRAQRSQLDG